MAVAIGQILKGTVVSLKKFGAFVKLPDGTIGLCHISEVSNKYVKEITDVLTEGQEVNIKVVGIDQGNKINLSIKEAEASKPVNNVEDFEKMMNNFMKSSDDKLKDIKNNKIRKSSSHSTKR
jgi:S1 RNA binding domain protein